jgi:hypothetical protein
MSIISSFSPSKWQTSTTVIAGGDTQDLDSIPLTSFSSTKYYIEMKSVPNNKFRSFELFGWRKSSSDVDDTVYARVGDQILSATSLLVLSGSVKLRIQNLESHSLTVKVTRLNH